MMVRSFALATVLAAMLAAPLHGQVQVGVTPFVGGFLPVGDIFDEVGLGGRVVLNLGHEPGAVFGGRVTTRLARVGVEAEAGYVISNVDLPRFVIQDAVVADDANIFLGSLNVVLVIFQAPFSPFSVYVSGGAGIVSRSGDFYDRFEDTTDPAGTIGLGLRFGLGPLAHVRFDLRDYISSFKPSTLAGVELQSNLQNDLIATLGLEFTLSPKP